MAFGLLFVLNARSPTCDRTYGITLALELIILGLWIPPTYAISKIVASSATVPQSTIVTLAFCGLNLYVSLSPIFSERH